MTEQEFLELEVGDTVYFYNNINLKKISHISAALKKRVVGKIFDSEDGRRIGFENHGILLKSILWMFDTDKEKLLYTKLRDIKTKINELYGGSLYLKGQYPNGIKQKFEEVMAQKNVEKMLEKYPELLI